MIELSKSKHSIFSINVTFWNLIWFLFEVLLFFSSLFKQILLLNFRKTTNQRQISRKTKTHTRLTSKFRRRRPQRRHRAVSELPRRQRQLQEQQPRPALLPTSTWRRQIRTASLETHRIDSSSEKNERGKNNT